LKRTCAISTIQQLSNLQPSPGDVDAFADPPRVGDLLHHKVGHIGAGDAGAATWQRFAVDAVDDAAFAVRQLSMGGITMVQSRPLADSVFHCEICDAIAHLSNVL
jgi:hypothetical protein